MEDKIYHVCTECIPYHVDNCGSCFGFGFHKGTKMIVGAGEIKDLTVTECDPCPECGGDLKNEHLYELKKEASKHTLEKIRSIKLEIESSPGSWVDITKDLKLL